MFKRQPAGQTILEVIISAAIITTGIVSLVTLIIYVQSSSRLTYQEAIALGLAQEGIEAARFIRDSNWLEREAGLGTSFNDGLYYYDATGGYDYTAIYVWKTWPPATITPADAITFDFTPDTDADTIVRVYENAQKQYRQSSSTTWTATPYTRFITLFPICSDDGGATESILTADGQDCASTADPIQIGVQVRVEVSWINSGNTLTRVLEERLYDWKYAE